MSDKSPIDSANSVISVDDVDAMVSADIPCLTCEYNLRSLSTKGRCPECGQPVRDTLDHHQLIGQAGMLNELVGFVNTMTASLILMTIALASWLMSLVVSPGPNGNLIIHTIAVTLVPFYWLTAMGSGIDLFRITKRPAFRHNLVAGYIFVLVIGVNLSSATLSISYFVISIFICVLAALATGTPVWFAQHTKHLATLTGNVKLKSLAKITFAICLVLPVLTLIILGWATIVRIVGQPNLSPIQSSNGLIKFVVLAILLATSTSSALLGLRLVGVAKKLRQTAKALQSQASSNSADRA